MQITSLTSSAEVLVATGHDPLARSSLRRPMTRGWMGGGAVAWIGVDPDERRPYLTALGAPPAAGALIGEIVGELQHRQRVTLPRGAVVHLPAWVGLDGTHWDFRHVSVAAPVQPGEDRVVELTDLADVRALLDAASPTTPVQPDDGVARRWYGIHGAAGLLACIADDSSTTGVGHLSAIAVSPTARRQGLGAAVTASLTRRLLAEGCDLVTLGMYADNDGGRALYDHLGFADDHRCTSGPLLVRSRW